MTQVRKKVRAVMNKGAFYFAQLTDIHIGQGLNPTEAAANLAWALAELEAYSPEPEMILATADLVCAGKRPSCHSWCSLFPQLWRTVALCRNWHRQWQTQTAAG
jgi:3',5'-cyclic AMP phosphodiesterase CpdA